MAWSPARFRDWSPCISGLAPINCSSRRSKRKSCGCPTSPIAAQIVRLVLEGFPENSNTVSPAPAGVKCRGVFIDDRGTAYVDLDGATIGTIHGADEEESLVAAVSRSLVDGLQEVKRVSFLIDGEPRDTLAGHVDLSRQFSGREWEVAGQGGTGGTR